MSLNDLQKKIEEEGRAESGKIESDARKAASDEISKANKQAKEMLAKAHAEIDEEAKRLTHEYEANSEIARNGIVLAAREEVVDRVMKSVRKDIISEMRSKQKKIFDNAIKVAKEMGDIKSMTIVVNRKDVDFVKKLGAKVEYGNISGGLRIMSDDKSVTIDASIDTMLDGRSDEVRSIVSHVLFGTGESAPHRKENRGAKTKAKSAKKKIKAATKKKVAKKISAKGKSRSAKKTAKPKKGKK